MNKKLKEKIKAGETPLTWGNKHFGSTQGEKSKWNVFKLATNGTTTNL